MKTLRGSQCVRIYQVSIYMFYLSLVNLQYINACRWVVELLNLNLLCWNCCINVFGLTRSDKSWLTVIFLLLDGNLVRVALWAYWVMDLKSYRQAEKGMTFSCRWLRYDSTSNVTALKIRDKLMEIRFFAAALKFSDLFSDGKCWWWNLVLVWVL